MEFKKENWYLKITLQNICIRYLL